MKKIIYILLLLILINFPITVFAREICEFSEKARIQKIASNVTTSYVYREVKGVDKGYNIVYFDVYISNVQDSIRIINTKTGERYYPNSNKEIIIKYQTAGSYLKYRILGNVTGCFEDNILDIYVTLPNFNKYYTDAICKKIPNYKLCNKWTNTSKTTYSQFKNASQKYIEGLNKHDDREVTENKLTLFEKVISFLADYSLIIFGSIVVICTGLIIYLIKKDDFDLSI